MVILRVPTACAVAPGTSPPYASSPRHARPPAGRHTPSLSRSSLWAASSTWGPQGQGVRGVKTMVKSVGGRQIRTLRIVRKEVRRCSGGQKKKTLPPLACGAPERTHEGVHQRVETHVELPCHSNIASSQGAMARNPDAAWLAGQRAWSWRPDRRRRRKVRGQLCEWRQRGERRPRRNPSSQPGGSSGSAGTQNTPYTRYGGA